ncbi:MurR/RpiR family transcriptional regulator [Terrilactibacillus laevilacticus]|uniref:MurR/RpiR family transcriptional regulator n=1 Tax=Terrilactibacillus laevilacticus TaxID=1380157 RepID=UPI001147501F|nr:MurR/RpiR family transcriptional regulator [Terrilactibacillus laevilacticus]
MLNGGLSRLKQALGRINPAELNAANYILNHSEKVIRMTVNELSEASHSSPSAIIRLCKSVGFTGFQDLKIRIAGDLQAQKINGEEYKEIHPNSDLATIISSVSNNSALSINETSKILDESKMEMVIQWLDQANRIDFYGTGASQLVAQDAQHKFMRINKVCTAYSDTHLQLTSAVTLTNKDVAVAFSYSGETVQTIDCIKKAKEQGAKTVGITHIGNNTLGKYVDINIELLSAEGDIRSAATSSRIVQLNIIDIIYIAIASRNYKKSLQYLNKSGHAINEKLRFK